MDMKRETGKERERDATKDGEKMQVCNWRTSFFRTKNICTIVSERFFKLTRSVFELITASICNRLRCDGSQEGKHGHHQTWHKGHSLEQCGGGLEKKRSKRSKGRVLHHLRKHSLHVFCASCEPVGALSWVLCDFHFGVFGRVAFVVI